MDVIVAICDHLDIWCLTIKHPYIPIDHHQSNRLQPEDDARKLQLQSDRDEAVNNEKKIS